MKNIMNKSLAAVHTHTHTGESNGLKNFEKEHKIKNYYGITLIALVITFIVFLVNIRNVDFAIGCEYL